MELETVIGLEIHAQLSTKTKLWCSCDNDNFQVIPNTRTCNICMGFPGVLPVLNKIALDKAIKASVVLNCEIQPFSKFDRKNYFYPDLPFGYQISQFDEPLALNGKVEIWFNKKSHNIKINRVHLENDAGKLTHENGSTFCDYNRAGTPLIEIVTEPDLRSPEEAQIFAKEVQKIVRFVDSSDADMEKGMMRFDASISMRPRGEKKLYPRVEIKNLNSFSSLLMALKYEEKRQKNLWEKGTPNENQCTVGWLDDTKKTQILRDKEDAADYRYFPEPDLPPLEFAEKEIEEFYKEKTELPLEKFLRYKKEFGFNENDALKLSENKNLANLLEETVEKSGDAKKSANFILTTVLANPNWEKSIINSQKIAETIELLNDGKISSTSAKQILEASFESEKSAKDLMKELGLVQVSDDSALEKWVDEVLGENPKVVEEFKNGKEKVIGFLVGQVMKKSQGSANPPVVNKIMLGKLGK